MVLIQLFCVYVVVVAVGVVVDVVNVVPVSVGVVVCVVAVGVWYMLWCRCCCR